MHEVDQMDPLEQGIIEQELLRRGPLSTAIPRVSAGGLKPEISARVWATRPGCYRAIVVKDPV
jgi:hypothetical protein